MGDVQVEPPLVEPIPLADAEQVELIRVVGHEDDAGLNRDSVDGELLLSATLTHHEEERAEARECLLPPAMVLAPMDERRIQAEREVVQEQGAVRAPDVDPALDAGEGFQGRERIVAVEAEIPREVVPRPVGNADKRDVALERDLGHASERPVAPGDAEGVGVGLSRKVSGVLALAEHVRLDTARLRTRSELLHGRLRVARARVDEEVRRQGAN
jgi:hypothetical protein